VYPIKLTERWIGQSENLLKTIEKLSTKKERDRLEIISSMILALNALDRSVHGWRSLSLAPRDDHECDIVWRQARRRCQFLHSGYTFGLGGGGAESG